MYTTVNTNTNLLVLYKKNVFVSDIFIYIKFSDKQFISWKILGIDILKKHALLKHIP